MDRAARRRGDPARSRWRQALLPVAGAVVLLSVAAVIVFVLVSAGGDDADANPGSSSNNGGAQPVLNGPASRFAASAEDIGGGIAGVPPESIELTRDHYVDPQIGPFHTIDEGRSKAAEWDYQEGYVGSLEPDGLIAGVAQGRYYVRVETHLFGTTQGAAAAFDWYDQVYAENTALTREEATSLANQSAGWTSVGDKFEGTNLDEVYHRVVFRRGNLVVIVQTVGAGTFMTIDPARAIAEMVDERALGSRAAPTPTPSGGTLPTTVPNP